MITNCLIQDIKYDKRLALIYGKYSIYGQEYINSLMLKIIFLPFVVIFDILLCPFELIYLIIKVFVEKVILKLGSDE